MASTSGISVGSLVYRQDDFQHFGGQPNFGSHFLHTVKSVKLNSLTYTVFLFFAYFCCICKIWILWFELWMFVVLKVEKKRQFGLVGNNRQCMVIVFLCGVVHPAGLLSAHSPTKCETSGGLKLLISVNVSVPLSVLALWYSGDLYGGVFPCLTPKACWERLQPIMTRNRHKLLKKWTTMIELIGRKCSFQNPKSDEYLAWQTH